MFNLELIFTGEFEAENFLSLLYVISLNFNVHFALVLHLNCTALGQPESSNFFMSIITA